MATIDVLMPAYNAERTLEEAVTSICEQTVADIRLIVVDDGSTDGTPAILSRLAAGDARICVVRQENSGIVGACNRALQESDAEFIARMDADDIALPHWLERTLGYLRSHPDCVAVGGMVDHMDETGAPLSGYRQPGSPDDARVDSIPALEPYIIHPTLTARRAAIVQVGGYRHVPNSEDSDLFWRLSEHGRLANIPDTLIRYRVHPSSISGSLTNGRVMAIGSQLGALSAARRRAGRQDLEFGPQLHQVLKGASSLEEMLETVAASLDRNELAHLRMAAAAKLMELARWRPFEPDASDCAFIRSAWNLADTLGDEDRRRFAWYLTVTAARLLRERRFRDVAELLPATFYPVALVRLALGQK